MKYLAGIAVLALMACQPGGAPVPTGGGAAPATAVPAGAFVAMLNAARTAQGRGAVTEDSRLTRAAQAHAQDMATRGYFSHRSPNGATFTDRARAAGYGCVAAENIAAGQRTEAEVMAEWMASAGHRRNILLPAATEFGFGRSGTYWVLMLGRGC
ncbi:CAP domain-containing protein [Thalassorhabdomicrobium marinisediminis]|uniref:CAP domain-containing protein n=1 Tax=Thalassorhabdomicrobium marinisediminis TaxID=2170577 RepID=UPI002491D4D8|nr:CAP domain-containing protein [Thalassorhabdomicrobium marinisediminis]